ncbi:MAG: SWIM zinc finger family protein [Singulisphaera sp.]
MARDSWWNDRDFPPSRPRKAEGGIKSQSKSGGFGESWWAKRWIELLESFHIGGRLARGRSYARSGQVLSIAIEKGKVAAKVQGSRPKPYDITIEVKTLSESDWAKVLDALARQALFAAKLLAGEMPQDIEPLFQEVGLSLFPAKLGDLTTDCSCPDSSNPCKHIAAAYYLLGEEFDRDPFLIFTLRGLGRDALIARLGATSPGRGGAGGSPSTSPRPHEPLSAEVETFWGEVGGRIEDPCGVVEIPSAPAAHARRLGGFPFWRGESPFLDTLSAMYVAASPRGLDVLLGPVSGVDRSEAE